MKDQSSIGDQKQTIIGQMSREKNGEKFKDFWYWRCVHPHEVNSVLKMFLPYFGERRTAKTIEALSYENIS